MRALSSLCLGFLLVANLTAGQGPADPLKLVTQGRRLNAAGKQPDAIRLYEQALAIDPNLFEGHLAMGIALDLEGRYADARRHLTRANALAPPESKVTALNATAVSYAFERKADQGAAPDAYVFPGRNGPISARGVQARLRTLAQRQGLFKNVHPHLLRHSFASHVLESSGDLRGVQELLGHADISTTQIYTHLDFGHLAKVYDAAHPRAKRKK